METSHVSNSEHPPATPSHGSLLPSASPTMSEQTPAPLRTLPQHLRPTIPQPRLGPTFSRDMSSLETVNAAQSNSNQMHPPAGPNAQGNVFGSVMGVAPGQGPTIDSQVGGAAQVKVYASVYSGIPVFEAMIRGISVMRRTADSWVNATQILKVAGVHKSARTKILEKEVLPGVHEKIQGGYGKYQGTWVPFERGHELAEQYGVADYLSPIFDFVPSASAVAALPVIRTGTPDRTNQRKPTMEIASNTIKSRPTHTAMSNHHETPRGVSQIRPASPFILPSSHPMQGNNREPIAGIPLHFSPLGYSAQQASYYPVPQVLPEYTQNPHTEDGTELSMASDTHVSNDTILLAPPPDSNPNGFMAANSDLVYTYNDQHRDVHGLHSFENDGTHGKRYQESGLTADTEKGFTAPVTTDNLQETYVDSNSSASDENVVSVPIPGSMRLSHKPARPKPHSTQGRTKARLVSLFSVDGHVDVCAALGILPHESAEFDIDMVIDNQGHTALHWACALANIPIARQLIDLGADIHRGNYGGETPLIRSVLTTNHSESGTFPQLLQLLSESICTLDHAYRSILHHIGLMAGIKGRAGSARSYLADVLEWVAREQQHATPHSFGTETSGKVHVAMPLNLRTLVDIQDVHGDTALNVAARVGNKGLVNLLLDAGADKAKANHLGLRPTDFGLDIEALKISATERAVSNLKSEIPRPERKSHDVQQNISSILVTISETFAREMLAKQTKLNATEASVRHATRALADKRQHLHQMQDKLNEMELCEQQIHNSNLVIASGAQLEEFSGRTQTSAEKAGGLPPPLAFRHIPGKALDVPSAMASDIDDDDPSSNEATSQGLSGLRRLALWEDRMALVLEDKIRIMEGEGAERSMQYRKLVSLCTKVSVEKVDGMLDGLMSAIESDGQSIDLSRISTFMSRMKREKA